MSLALWMSVKNPLNKTMTKIFQSEYSVLWQVQRWVGHSAVAKNGDVDVASSLNLVFAPSRSSVLNRVSAVLWRPHLNLLSNASLRHRCLIPWREITSQGELINLLFILCYPLSVRTGVCEVWCRELGRWDCQVNLEEYFSGKTNELALFRFSVPNIKPLQIHLTLK